MMINNNREIYMAYFIVGAAVVLYIVNPTMEPASPGESPRC
jgi:hypothetical protein